MSLRANKKANQQELLSIGQVLALLQKDFTELTPSKLRFLEEQGLLTPERTKSGYRKFSQNHIERLRLILTLQRDHYLPLKVIAEILEDIDNGVEPSLPSGSGNPPATILQPRAVLTKEELLKETGASKKLLAESIAFGLLPAKDVFPRESIVVLNGLALLAKKGITPRHLRSLRVAAEKDAQLLKQVAANRQLSASNLSAQEIALELAESLDAVKSGVLRFQLLQ